jgi:sugar phosphate permease
MFASSAAAWFARRGIHFAWVVAAVTFLTALTMSGALGLPGAMLQPLAKEFGWDYGQISTALAVRFALFGLMAPFSALLILRFGMRAVMVTALALVGAGMLLVTRIGALWELFALWGVLLAVATGLTALVLGAMVSNRWFSARRGLVVGILSAATATGQLAFLPLAAWLIGHYGWRAAVIPPCVTCLLAALLVLALMRDHPAELGLTAFGEPADAVPAPPPAAAAAWNAPFGALVEGARNGTFWILFATFFICGLSTNGLVQTHFITLCGDYGLAAVPAASVLAAMGGFDIFGTVLSGWLSDRYDNRVLLFWYYGLRGLSLFWLPNSGFTLAGLSVFALFYGLDWLATVPPTVRLASNAFGKERVGLFFGWIFAAHQIGAAFAAFGAGFARTHYLSYTPALYTAGLWCVLAAVLVLTMRSGRRVDRLAVG